jgi:hypothetical protein
LVPRTSGNETYPMCFGFLTRRSGTWPKACRTGEMQLAYQSKSGVPQSGRWRRIASPWASPWHLTQRDGQGLPAGNGPGTGAGLDVVGDGGEQPAQLDRGRELAALLVDGTDRGSLSLGDDEHAGRMGVRIEDGKLTITVFRSELAKAICFGAGDVHQAPRGDVHGSTSWSTTVHCQCEEQEIGDG